LADGSPCIDAGINRDWMSGAVDLAGSERINNGTVDIGAYEAQGRPSLWVGSADLGGGWRRLDWFGAFWDPGSGWIYHAEHGWMYALADTTSSIWFYTFDLGWLWSGSWAYPWLWRANDGAWLYYFRDTSPRAFYNVTTGQAEWH
jgi:hypothetical protein